MEYLDKTKAIIPPMEGSPIWSPFNLSGTGSTEEVNPRALSKGRIYELFVGDTPIRVSFRPVGGIANAVTAASVVIPANTIYPFLAMIGPDAAYGSLFVYVEAADGVSVFEAHVAQRGR